MIRTVVTNLKGFRNNCWDQDLTGFFDYKGKPMTDTEIRAVVEYGINHGYETEADIPSNIVDLIIKYCNVEPEKVNQLKLF